MTLEKRVEAFLKLGEILLYLSKKEGKKTNIFVEKKIEEEFEKLLIEVPKQNAWFTKENLFNSFIALIELLEKENITKWLSAYEKINKPKEKHKIGVIMAGNIPAVGFHDLLCVLISGNHFVGKFSSKDSTMEFLCKTIIEIEPEFEKYISINEKISPKEIDAIIATGSNNTARYFEYYFGNKPNVIRKNRNSVAILNGKETKEQLEQLSNDIFMYFGLGCRSVSKVYIPENYAIENIFLSFEKHSDLRNHNKYANNYDYHRAIYLMEQHKFLDNGFVILKENEALNSPVSVVHYQKYNNKDILKKELEILKEELQCIVGGEKIIDNMVDFGQSQKPTLSDYADNIDTMKFLLNL